MDGAVGFNEGGEGVAGLDELAVLGVEVVGVVLLVERGKAVEFQNAAVDAAGVVELRSGGQAEIIVEAFSLMWP